MSLAEADYGMTNSAMNTSRFIGDETLLVKFYTHPKLQRKESEEAQRPIYKDTAYIQIMQPGSKDSIVIRPASSMDKARFPEHWKKFQAREEQEVIGTPLTEWGGVTRSQAEELRFLNIMTIEQLVATSDANSQNIMGFQNIKAKAAKFLDNAADGAAAAHLKAELSTRDGEIAELKAQMAELMSATKPKRKRRTPAEMAAAKTE